MDYEFEACVQLGCCVSDCIEALVFLSTLQSLYIVGIQANKQTNEKNWIGSIFLRRVAIPNVGDFSLQMLISLGREDKTKERKGF